MNIEKLEGLDWKNDENLLGVQKKIAGLTDRERLALQRRETLVQVILAGDEALVAGRVSVMLGEEAAESEADIEARIAPCKRDVIAIDADIQAIKLAQDRLVVAQKDAAHEAKLRVAAMILPPYREIAEELRASLTDSLELCRKLHRIHHLACKQDFRRDIIGTDLAIALNSRPLGWIGLALPDGTVNPDLKFWFAQVEKALE